MNKRIFYILSIIMLVSSLCACGKEKNQWPGYAGTMENYEYYYAEERNRAWEEDVLYLAETFLTNHPLLTDDEVRIVTYTGANFENEEAEYSDRLYDEGQRQAFIDRINLLIPRIGELGDTEIIYETQRIVASLSDMHSSVIFMSGESFPIVFEPIFDGDGYSFFATKVPAEMKELLYGKLISINDISADEIKERMTPYISHEYEGWVIQQNTLLSLKSMLQVIDVMGEDENEIKLVLETEQGLVECSMNAVTDEEYEQMELTNGSMRTSEYTAYRYADERNYWYEIVGENTLYIRILSSYEDPEQSFDSFFVEIGTILRDAPNPMKVIIDYRNNNGGFLTHGLGAQISRRETDGVYILINGKCASAAVLSPYLLAHMIPDAKLVGSPASHFVNILSYPAAYTMPNSGQEFWVSTQYKLIAPDENEITLLPDITVYQTPEDYKNGVDTVLEYVLEIDK